MMATIVAGVDGSASGQEALRFAVREARLRGAGLRVVTAWHMPNMTYGGGGFGPGISPAGFEESATAAQRRHSPGSVNRQTASRSNEPCAWVSPQRY
jgi:nucleotide-binding universal stress UspA family protein